LRPGLPVITMRTELQPTSRNNKKKQMKIPSPSTVLADPPVHVTTTTRLMTHLNHLAKIKKPIPSAVFAFFISLLWLRYGPSLHTPLQHFGLKASFLQVLSLPAIVIFIFCALPVEIKNSIVNRIIYGLFVTLTAMYFAIWSLVIFSCITAGSCP
jgi:hypothetical protein